MRIVGLLIFGAGILELGACAVAPTVDGESLECKTDDDCPALVDDAGESIELRCFDEFGLCGVNSAPRIDGALGGDVIVHEDVLTIVLSATGTDDDEDKVRLYWRQLGGPEVILGNGSAGDEVDLDNGVTPTSEGNSEGLQATIPGLYSFSVRPQDSLLLFGSPQNIDVYVEPAGDVTYLSQDGEDNDECGGYLRPCSTLEQALVRANTTGADRIFVSAEKTGEPYLGCLELDHFRIEGCFDSETWIRIPEGRARCRIECDKATGHVIHGASWVEGLSLTSSAEGSANALNGDDDGASSSQVYGASVALSGDSPTLRDVTVTTPACGADCIAIGVVTGAENAVMEDISIVGSIVGFEPLLGWFGVITSGGSTALRSSSGQSLISINAPVTSSATGILSSVGNISISNLRIEGGFAPRMVGIENFGGTLNASELDIELGGFGASEILGVYSAECVLNDDFCVVPQADGFDDDNTEETVKPQVTVQNSLISLSASSASQGTGPCFGAGLRIDGEQDGVILSDNVVSLSENFGLGVGINIVSAQSTGADNFATTTKIERNTVSVGANRKDELCSFLFSGRAMLPVVGSVGINIHRVDRVWVEDNQIEVLVDESAAVGLSAIDSYDLLMKKNNISTGGASYQSTDNLSIGAVLIQNEVESALGQNSSPNLFTQNLIYSSAFAFQSFGVLVENTIVAPSAALRVEQNMIHGGQGQHSVGLRLANRSTRPDTSVFYNTIDGGGGPQTGSSMAIEYRQSAFFGDTLVAFENNLLLAGSGRGRRQIFESRPGFAAVKSLPLLNGNYGEYIDEVAAPQPILVFPQSGLLTEEPSRWFGLANVAALKLDLTEAPSDPYEISEFAALPMVGDVQAQWSKLESGGGNYQVALVASNTLLAGRFRSGIQQDFDLDELGALSTWIDFDPTDFEVSEIAYSGSQDSYVLSAYSGGEPRVYVIDLRNGGGESSLPIEFFAFEGGAGVGGPFFEEDLFLEFNEFLNNQASEKDSIPVDVTNLSGLNTEVGDIAAVAAGNMVYVVPLLEGASQGGVVLDYGEVNIGSENHVLSEIQSLRIFELAVSDVGDGSVTEPPGGEINGAAQQVVMSVLARSTSNDVNDPEERIRPYLFYDIEPFAAEGEASKGSVASFGINGEYPCETSNTTAMELFEAPTSMVNPGDFSPGAYGLPGASTVENIGLVLGCEDGAVEFYWLVFYDGFGGPAPRFMRVARSPFAQNEAIRYIRGGVGENLAMRVAATVVDSSEVRWAGISGFGETSTISAGVWTMAGDVALRDGNRNIWTDLAPSFDGNLWAPHSSNPDYSPPCPVIGQSLDGGGRLTSIDLHLDTTSGNDCVDAAVDLQSLPDQEVLSDFDGELSREDTAADIGADEVSP